MSAHKRCPTVVRNDSAYIERVVQRLKEGGGAKVGDGILIAYGTPGDTRLYVVRRSTRSGTSIGPTTRVSWLETEC